MVCPDVGSGDKGDGMSLGCSNWDFLTGIIPVGGIAGVVAPGLDLWGYGGCVGMWVDTGRLWWGRAVADVDRDGLRVWPHLVGVVGIVHYGLWVTVRGWVSWGLLLVFTIRVSFWWLRLLGKG